MPFLPVAAAALVLLAALSSAVGLTFGDSRYPEDSSLLLAIDLVVLGAVASIGILVSKRKWARLTALAVTLASVASALALLSGWQAGAAAVVGIVAAGTLVGPWMNRWWVAGRKPDSPPRAAVILVLSLLTMPGLIAAASPNGLSPGRWLIGLASLGLGWTYSQAWLPALWSVRIGLVPATAAALIGSDVVGGLIILGGAAFCTAMAWTKKALVAATPPTPVRGTTYPIPPELAPEEVIAEIPRRPPPAHRGDS